MCVAGRQINGYIERRAGNKAGDGDKATDSEMCERGGGAGGVPLSATCSTPPPFYHHQHQDWVTSGQMWAASSRLVSSAKARSPVLKTPSYEPPGLRPEDSSLQLTLRHQEVSEGVRQEAAEGNRSLPGWQSGRPGPQVGRELALALAVPPTAGRALRDTSATCLLCEAALERSGGLGGPTHSQHVSPVCLETCSQ
uniref:Uncharacterized protein n=1 Tax=Knipowitschia caucasica TaxID=637954 RepID=A0AAV2JCA1_KNICA